MAAQYPYSTSPTYIYVTDPFQNRDINTFLSGVKWGQDSIGSTALNGTNGRPAIDRITDFNSCEDKLDLRD